jgi:competence protein ComEC
MNRAAPIPESTTSTRTGRLWADPLWQAPLALVALAATAGLVLDRHVPIGLPISLGTAAVGLLAWLASWLRRVHRQAVVFLCLTTAALGAAYHHWHIHSYAADDIGHFVRAEPKPAHLRGVLEEEPITPRQPPEDVLLSFHHGETTTAMLAVTEVCHAGTWVPVSGRVRLTVAGRLPGLHVGDEIDVVGRLSAPRNPGNPGEFDFSSYLRDQRIRAVVQVQKTSEAITRLNEGWPRSLRGWLAVLRGRCRSLLEQMIPQEREQGLAIALLLGDGSSMSREDWDRYTRTGVVHVLVVSGQHLVVLAVFLWFVLRCLEVRRRTGAVIIAVSLLVYSLMVGMQPPIMRSAVMACAVCGAILLRRPGIAANTFALSWLVVGVLNPTDLCSTGCQLSFLCVALLIWGSRFWLRRKQDSLDRLVEKSRPTWQRLSLWLLRAIGMSFAVSLGLWLAVAPLVALRYNTISPTGVLLTPPLVLLTSVALLIGFLLLLVAWVSPLLAVPFARLTCWSLTACDQLVNLADALPCGHIYVPNLPTWWIWVLYVGITAVVLLECLQRYRRWLMLAGIGWLCVGLLGGAAPRSSDEMRCTFLSVGHGICTVIEAPDGRFLLYDAGAMRGPDVARRQIAPFLWHRGIRRIDEVFLSHADLDHFNGLPALLERFAVGQVSCIPGFFEKRTPAVDELLRNLERYRVPRRTVRTGDWLTAGGLEMEVLHPAEQGTEQTENARCLVLRMQHAGHKLLLTGDVDGEGQQRVLQQPTEPLDVLTAPHHGSRTANSPALAAWAQPRFVIASQGPPRGPARKPEPYSGRGARYLDTWTHGAITIRSHATGLVIETFRSKQRWVAHGNGEPPGW